MKFHQLEYAIKVADMRNISAAAKELYITQPSLSQQITALENELGIKIFLRTARGIQISEAGENFLRYARSILSEVSNMKNAMNSYANLMRGSLKIGMFYTSGYLKLYDDIVAFRREYPQVELFVQVDSSVNLYRSLTEQSLDVAILIAGDYTPQNADIGMIRIAESAFAAAIHKDNPLSLKAEVSLEELRDEPLILPPQGSFVRRILFESDFDHNIPWKICAESSPTEACLQMVNSGLGIALTSFVTAESFNTGFYRTVPLKSALRQSIYLAFPKCALSVPLARSFCSFLLKRRGLPPLDAGSGSTASASGRPLSANGGGTGRSASLGAVILAGGKSRRMKQDKALLPYRGGTLLSHQLLQLPDLHEILLSVDRAGRYAGYGLQEIEDVFPDCGPLGGIYSALSQCSSDRLLVVPCDMLNLRRTFLLALCTHGDVNADAVVLRDRSGSVHPVCGIYRKSALPYLRDRLAGGDFCMRAVLAEMNTQYLDVRELGFPDSVFANLNSISGYEFWRNQTENIPIVSVQGRDAGACAALCGRIAEILCRHGLQTVVAEDSSLVRIDTELILSVNAKHSPFPQILLSTAGDMREPLFTESVIAVCGDSTAFPGLPHFSHENAEDVSMFLYTILRGNAPRAARPQKGS